MVSPGATGTGLPVVESGDEGGAATPDHRDWFERVTMADVAHTESIAIDATIPPAIPPRTSIRRLRRAAAVAAAVSAVVVVMATGTIAGAAGQSARTASSTAWRPELLAPIHGSSHAFLIEARRPSCSGAPRLRLVAVSVQGAVDATRTLPAYHADHCQPTGTISSVDFATVDDGIVLEYSRAGLPTLYATTDGGRSWRARPLVDATTSGSARDFVVAPSGVTYITARCATNDWCRDFTLESSTWSSASWRAMDLPATPTQAGVVQAQFGTALWVYELHHSGVTLYYSPTGRAPFTHWSANRLGSVEACVLTPTSLTHLWAECPTGMMVSFLTSNDGGRTWRAVSQYEFAGTGGGTFDPVSSSLALLDYGSESTISHDDLYRIDGAGRTTPVGRFACATAGAMDFSTARVGIALCLSPTSGSTRPVLERTSDGGRAWVAVSLGA